MHQINTISLNFKTPKKAKAWRWQQQFNQLIKQDLLPKIERLLDEIDDGQSLYQLGTLDINIGKLHPDTFEQVFIDKVIDQIDKQLKNINTTGRNEREQIVKINQTAIAVQAFLSFLETGIIRQDYKKVFEQIEPQKLIELIKQNRDYQISISHLLKHSKKAVKRLNCQFTTSFAENLVQILSKVQENNSFKKNLSQIVDEKEEVIPVISKLVQEVKNKKLYIDNAGIILIHPFLFGNNENGFALFEKLGLVENQQFIDEQAQMKALHILQYLAWGKEEQPEYNMVLDKLICGILPDIPINRFVIITKQDKIICDQLIELLTQNWKGLEGTSIEGMQANFFQRLGKLEETSIGWKLSVETQTIDILLKRFPYGIGIIKLPCMLEMLWVDWDY